jgi:hypothetical protein
MVQWLPGRRTEVQDVAGPATSVVDWFITILTGRLGSTNQSFQGSGVIRGGIVRNYPGLGCCQGR